MVVLITENVEEGSRTAARLVGQALLLLAFGKQKAAVVAKAVEGTL